MDILFKARCTLMVPNNGIIKSVFTVEDLNGEYAMFNLRRERGDLEDFKHYFISIYPAFPKG